MELATVRSYNLGGLTSRPHPSVNGVQGSWSSGKSQLLDSHDRFRPEKYQRRPVLKMQWAGSTGNKGHMVRWQRSIAGDLFPGSGSNPTSFSATAIPLESESRVNSMSIADVSPRIALKKVLVMYEHGQFAPAAVFLRELTLPTFRVVLGELPIDLLVEAMPSSLPILDILYTKIFSADGPSPSSLKPLKPESVVMHMIRFFSKEDPQKIKDNLTPCRNLLRIIVLSDRKFIRTVSDRRRALNKAVETLGQHGHVGTTDKSLLPLHSALKHEFKRVVEVYKGALGKLEELSLAAKNAPKVTRGPAPYQDSHQRQLSLRAEEIQERLIKNKSLLNAVEATLDNHCLDVLLGILQRRVDGDKDALFQFNQLRREAGAPQSVTLVAPLLMTFSRGCKRVLDLMREALKESGGGHLASEDDSSDLSGYHSDSDSAMMTSGNSPFISPRARFNFLSRSVRSKTMGRPGLFLPSPLRSSRSSSAGTMDQMSFLMSLPPSEGDSGFSASSSATPTRLRSIKQRNQISKGNSIGSTSSETSSSPSSILDFAGVPPECITVVSVPDDQVLSQGYSRPALSILPIDSAQNKTISNLREELDRLRSELANANASIDALKRTKLTPLKIEGESDRRAQLVREFGALYAQARVDTMDALDGMPELANADELKSKLLFSVIVLAFRSVHNSVEELRGRLRSLLRLTPGQDGEIGVFGAVGGLISEMPENFELARNVEQVANQIWTTLYDYPCLRTCPGLMRYIWTCAKLAWGFSNLGEPCVLEYEKKCYSKEFHVRFHSSDSASEIIRTHIWPALITEGGECLHKGVVIT